MTLIYIYINILKNLAEEGRLLVSQLILSIQIRPHQSSLLPQCRRANGKQVEPLIAVETYCCSAPRAFVHSARRSVPTVLTSRAPGRVVDNGMGTDRLGCGDDLLRFWEPLILLDLFGLDLATGI